MSWNNDKPLSPLYFANNTAIAVISLSFLVLAAPLSPLELKVLSKAKSLILTVLFCYYKLQYKSKYFG